MSNNNTASRRDFLKSTTAAAAGLALAGGLSIARSAHAAENSELKIALIGCGGRGTGAAVNCLDSVENVKLIAVADAFADRAKSCAADLKKKYGDRIDLPEERVFVGFDAYEKAIAAGADVVLIATSPGFRPIHYAAAIAAGKHVFMEKPCCIDAPGFRSLLETNKLADEKNLKVVVGLQRRYQASYLNGIKKIHDGEIGDVILCQAYWNGGEPWFRDRTPEMTEMEYQMRNWYHFVWLCGDNICEQHVHNLDVCNWVKNAHPKEANGMGACVQRYKNRDPKKGSGQIYDSHFVEFTYPDDSKMYSQCRQIPNTWNSVSEKVFGTKGNSTCQSGGHGRGTPTSRSTSSCSRPSARTRSTTTAITAPPAASRPCWAAWPITPARSSRGTMRRPRGRARCRRSMHLTPIRGPCPIRTACTRSRCRAFTSRTECDDHWSGAGISACPARL